MCSRIGVSYFYGSSHWRAIALRITFGDLISMAVIFSRERTSMEEILLEKCELMYKNRKAEEHAAKFEN